MPTIKRRVKVKSYVRRIRVGRRIRRVRVRAHVRRVRVRVRIRRPRRVRSPEPRTLRPRVTFPGAPEIRAYVRATFAPVLAGQEKLLAEGASRVVLRYKLLELERSEASSFLISGRRTREFVKLPIYPAGKLIHVRVSGPSRIAGLGRLYVSSTHERDTRLALVILEENLSRELRVKSGDVQFFDRLEFVLRLVEGGIHGEKKKSRRRRRAKTVSRRRHRMRRLDHVRTRRNRRRRAR